MIYMVQKKRRLVEIWFSSFQFVSRNTLMGLLRNEAKKRVVIWYFVCDDLDSHWFKNNVNLGNNVVKPSSGHVSFINF